LPIDRYRQGLTLWTFPSKDDAPACAKLELELLEKLVTDGITPKELNFAKKSLVRSHAFSVDTAAKRMSLALDTAMLGLAEDFYERYEERVSAVTLEQANAALKARVDPSRLVIAVVGTAKDLQERILEAVPSVTSVEIIPYDSEDL
jgi:zinc protease